MLSNVSVLPTTHKNFVERLNTILRSYRSSVPSCCLENLPSLLSYEFLKDEIMTMSSSKPWKSSGRPTLTLLKLNLCRRRSSTTALYLGMRLANGTIMPIEHLESSGFSWKVQAMFYFLISVGLIVCLRYLLIAKLKWRRSPTTK